MSDGKPLRRISRMWRLPTTRSLWVGMSTTLRATTKHAWRGANPVTVEEAPDSKYSRLSALLIPICTSPVCLLFRGNPGRALAAWVFSGALVMSIKFFWGRRRHLWFWLTVAVLTALHVMLVVYVPWPGIHTTIGGPALVPFGLLDVAIMCGCFKLVEKVMGGGDAASSQA